MSDGQDPETLVVVMLLNRLLAEARENGRLIGINETLRDQRDQALGKPKDWEKALAEVTFQRDALLAAGRAK